MLCGSAFQRARAGDFETAYSEFKEAARIGARFKDPDLTASARHGEGRALVMMNRSADGFAMLDEVMVAVTSGEVGPMIAGVVYCSVISACHDLFDLRRAQEWTTALAGWCAPTGFGAVSWIVFDPSFRAASAPRGVAGRDR